MRIMLLVSVGNMARAKCDAVNMLIIFFFLFISFAIRAIGILHQTVMFDHLVKCDYLKINLILAVQVHQLVALSIGTSSTNFVESDLGYTSRIYFHYVTFTLHNVTLTAQKPCQHNNKCECSKNNGYKWSLCILFSKKHRYIAYIIFIMILAVNKGYMQSQLLALSN